MTDFVDPLGVMQSGFTLRSQIFNSLEDGWKMILPGEEVRRSKELKRIAITRAEITFNSEDNLNNFFEIIKESDARLSRIPDDQVMYDWQMVYRNDLTVRFGVAWYDENYYLEKKDVWRESMHFQVSSKFEISPESVRIEHIPF